MILFFNLQVYEFCNFDFRFIILMLKISSSTFCQADQISLNQSCQDSTTLGYTRDKVANFITTEMVSERNKHFESKNLSQHDIIELSVERYN